MSHGCGSDLISGPGTPYAVDGQKRKEGDIGHVYFSVKSLCPLPIFFCWAVSGFLMNL